MIGTATAIGGLASLAGGVGNYLANSSASERAQLLQNKALQEWIKLQIPDPAAQQLALKQFVSAGKLDPKLEQSIHADPSAFKNIVTDISNKNAQNRALSELSDLGNQGGLRLQDKAALQDSMDDSISRERGDRLAIGQEMARRGLGGSGFELAGKLQAAQSGADRNARAGLHVAAKAQDRALQAIMGAGDMATKLRGQDFSEQAQRASAEDKINLFNTQNLQDVQQRNLAMQNRASEMNLAQAQKTSDQNTQLGNYEQEHNKKLKQEQYDNEVKKAAGISGQYNNQANGAFQQGQNLGNFFTNMGTGINSAATAIAQQDFWDNYFKENKEKNKKKESES